MSHITRRHFMKASALAGLAATNIAMPAYSRDRAPSEKINIALVGPNGQGHFTFSNIQGENVIALCDADSLRLEQVAGMAPEAAKFSDFRKMFETVKDLDAVCVCTPDHTHAPASVMGMRMGLHCYCEKPLTHSVYESRVMQQIAAEKKLVTQMGTQIHAENNYRRVVEMVQAGAVGKIREAHVWCGKGWGMPEDAKRPEDTPACPDTLNWDAWIGPAKMRPYHPAYVPGNWRKWWDFGNGTLGDMGCHYMDLAFWALKLKDCLTVEANGPAVNAECAPLSLGVTYTFPARGDAFPACTVTWHDGDMRAAKLDGLSLPGAGVLFVGDDDKMLFADYGGYRFFPEDKYRDYQRPEQTIAASPGHHNEWLQGIRENKPELALCNFAYSGRLTEAVLLGTVAYRAGAKLEWNAEKLEVTNNAEANAMIKTEYRDGWTL